MTKSKPHIAFIFIFLFLSSAQLFGQKKDIVQFSGFIKATGTDIDVPYVTIKNTSNANSIYVANHEGYFSFVAHKGDILEFSSIGYQTFTYTIPQVDSDRYTAKLNMESLVEELPVVIIGRPLPWASIEEFNAEFLALNSGYDEHVSARKNLSPEAIAHLAMVLPRGAEEIQSSSRMMQHNTMSNRNMHQNALTPFTNPFAWGQFINKIKSGDYSRKKLKY